MEQSKIDSKTFSQLQLQIYPEASGLFYYAPNKTNWRQFAPHFLKYALMTQYILYCFVYQEVKSIFFLNKCTKKIEIWQNFVNDIKMKYFYLSGENFYNLLLMLFNKICGFKKVLSRFSDHTFRTNNQWIWKKLCVVIFVNKILSLRLLAVYFFVK